MPLLGLDRPGERVCECPGAPLREAVDELYEAVRERAALLGPDE
ncbi:hypothetical protein ACFYNZ_04750 [Streptomyces kebangsaanensis]|uniref:Uncharacterized protein n=1 Tax=Streptomyces kebangsaanensis TaxID=864058 RepID=A0ABW6KN64_9ACTN